MSPSSRPPCQMPNVQQTNQPAARKVVAAALAALSVVVIWSEATIFTGGHPDLSPFSRLIRCVVGDGGGGVCVVGWVGAVIATNVCCRAENSAPGRLLEGKQM